MNKINPDRIRRFTDHYLETLNASESAIAAGYAPGNAAKQGYLMLKRDDVQEVLHCSRQKAIKAAGLSAERCLRELANLAYSDVRNVLSWDTIDVNRGDGILEKRPFIVATASADLSPEAAAAVSEISYDPRTGFRIKLHDKAGALDKLARHFNLYAREPKGVADDIAALIQSAQGTALPLSRKDQE